MCMQFHNQLLLLHESKKSSPLSIPDIFFPIPIPSPIPEIDLRIELNSHSIP